MNLKTRLDKAEAEAEERARARRAERIEALVAVLVPAFDEHVRAFTAEFQDYSAEVSEIAAALGNDVTTLTEEELNFYIVALFFMKPLT